VPGTTEERCGLCVVLVDSVQAADRLGRVFCRAGTVVLTIHREYSRRPGAADPRDEAALGWAADHAHELGADDSRLLLVGEGTGAGSAAWLALKARDLGWPRLVGQLLIAPRFTGGLPTEVEHVAPATILAAVDGDSDDDARRYASVLRAADVRVAEFSHGGPVTDLVLEQQLIAATARAFSAEERTASTSSAEDNRTGARS
jgi:acetyl esterase/lipase